MFLAALLACFPAPTLEGDWAVDQLAFDRASQDQLGDVTGTAVIQAEGAGVLVLEGPELALTLRLTVTEEGGGMWHMSGRTNGLTVLDLSCDTDLTEATCVDAGEVDWTDADSDSYVVLLSMIRD